MRAVLGVPTGTGTRTVRTFSVPGLFLSRRRVLLAGAAAGICRRDHTMGEHALGRMIVGADPVTRDRRMSGRRSNV
jgi:hypothetical protein